MRPSGLAIYMRQKVGKMCLLKSARTPFHPINTKDVDAGGLWCFLKSIFLPSFKITIAFLPLAADVNKFLSVKRKGFRKPRLSEPTVATLKQNVHQNPIRIIRPSPTPISPSYKAKSSTKVRSGWKV